MRFSFLVINLQTKPNFSGSEKSMQGIIASFLINISPLETIEIYTLFSMCGTGLYRITALPITNKTALGKILHKWV